MKPNPYTPPSQTVAASSRSDARGQSPGTSATPLYSLCGIAALTLLLAWIDAMQEGVPGLVFTLQVTFGAVVAQIPGMVCGALHRKTNNFNTKLFLVPAFCIAGISLLIYTMYVLAGQVQTVNNAAQMHVIIIPILLVALALGAYFVTGVIWAGLKLTQRSA